MYPTKWRLESAYASLPPRFKRNLTSTPPEPASAFILPLTERITEGTAEVQACRSFALAGNARFTIADLEDSVACMYWLRFKPKGYYSVSLIGEHGKTVRVGMLTVRGNAARFKPYSWSNIAEDDTPITALKQALGCTGPLRTIAPAAVMFHHGRCGRCNHHLRTPEAVERGFGDHCWKFMEGA